MRRGIRYCGTIDQPGVDEVRNLIQPGDTRLVITSIGGTLDAPLNLAQLVLEAQLDVEIAGPCFSGCASAVFIAGNSRIVSPTGVLGFHNSATSAYLMASHIFGDDAAIDMAGLQERSARESNLYARKAVDPDLLVLPQIEIDTLCVSQSDERTLNGETVFDIASTIDVWSPDADTLRAQGIAFVGDYPQTAHEIQSRLDRYLGQLSRFEISVGRPRVTRADLYRRLYAIGRCLN